MVKKNINYNVSEEKFIEYMINDERIVGVYNAIDKVNITPANHGMKHILNVLDIADKFLSLYMFIEKGELIIKTALILHDIGQVDGRENHGYKSMIFAKNYLENFNIFTTTELEMIYSAIETHDECYDYSLLKNEFSWLVNMIDKFDFAKNRLEKDYKERFEYSVYEDIDHLEFSRTKKDLTIKIIKIDNPKIICQKKLFERNLFSKAMLTFIKYCEKFNYVPKVYLGEEEIDLTALDKSVIVAR